MKPWQTAVRYGAIIVAVILIINIVSWGLKLFGVVIGLTSSGVLDEAKVYEFDAEVDRLDMDIPAARLVIRYENCDGVTVKSNLANLTAKERSGKLKVDVNKGRISTNEAEPFVEVLIPVGTLLSELDLDLGAGETLISSINAEKADIDGGAGKLTFRRCVISELDLDMGIGELDFHGKIAEKADVSLGVGKSEFWFLGNKDDYQLVLERGIGSVSIGGEEVGNSKIGTGDIVIDIDGGIGEINVNFEG